MNAPDDGPAFAIIDVDGPTGGTDYDPGVRATLHIADGDCCRHFPVKYRAIDTRDGDRIFRVRHARLMLESGWTVSMIWGDTTHSTNHDAWLPGGRFTEHPQTIEVAVMDRDGRIANPDMEPFGYQSPKAVLAIIDLVMTLPTDAPFADYIQAGGGV